MYREDTWGLWALGYYTQEAVSLAGRLAILFLTCRFLRASLLHFRAKVRWDVAGTGRAERSTLSPARREQWDPGHSTCGRPAEGLARKAEIKLRLDGQESTSFSEQSSWSVETLERFGNLSPESICLWCWGCTWPFDPHLRVHLCVLSERCFGHYVSPLS